MQHFKGSLMESADVLILGSGFGSSLLAMILARQGREVAVVDVAEHPRFAIGESTTPLGDLTLKDIANRWELPELKALTSYGTMREHLPGLRCGRKRGFTYFGFGEDAALQDLTQVPQMLVSASESDYLSDTHWMRSDVDQYFLMTAMGYGVRFCLGCQYEIEEQDGGWHLTGTVMDREVDLSAAFVVDATGAEGRILKALGVGQQTQNLKTNSSAVYGHFFGLKRLGAMLQDAGVDISCHPYVSDDAAVHHVLRDGWMWQLPFDDGSTSVGMVWDQRHGAGELAESTQSGPNQQDAERRWMQLIRESSVLRSQFENVRIARPETGLISTSRLQRLASQAAGRHWAALPSTAGFIDPLHSTGIAHTLFGVQRLADILLTQTGPSLEYSLKSYSDQVLQELRWVDELVECCYAAKGDFRLFRYAVLLHFCSVTSQEFSAVSGVTSGGAEAFLRSDDDEFRTMFREARQRIGRIARNGCTDDEVEEFRGWLQQSTAAWNHVGLFEADDDFMYSSTAVGDDARRDVG